MNALLKGRRLIGISSKILRFPVVAKLAIIGLLIAFSGSVGAVSILANHVQVTAWGSPGSPSLGFDYTLAGSGPIAGDGLVDTGSLSAVNGTFSVSGQARAQTGPAGLHARAASAGPEAASQFSDKFASSATSASWRDVLFVSGAGTAPATLRFNFAVDAALTISNVAPSPVAFRPNISSSGLTAMASPTTSYPLLPLSPTAPIYSAKSIVVKNTDGVVSAISDPTDGTPSGWNSASLTTTDGLSYLFNGSFSLLSNYYSASFLGAADGGYLMNVGLGASASNRGGSSTADAFNTLTLTSVTLPDGGALPAGFGFNFDSGVPLSAMTVAPVPLPPAFWLFATAIAALGRMARPAKA